MFDRKRKFKFFQKEKGVSEENDMKEERLQYQIIERYIKNPDFLNKQQEAIDCIMNQVEIMNGELSGRYKRDVIDSIIFRTKSAESIKKKLIRKGLPLNVESVEARLHDLTGVRITCVFLDDVYRVVERLEASSHFKILRIKDYIKEPKLSGYQSIHIIMEVPVREGRDRIRAEIQLRTIGMNFWAKLDHQLAYKMDDSEEVEKIRRDLKFHAEEIARIDRKLLKIRKKIEKLQDKKIPEK